MVQRHLSGSAQAMPGALPSAVLWNGDTRAVIGNAAQREHAGPCHKLNEDKYVHKPKLRIFIPSDYAVYTNISQLLCFP